MAKISYLGPDEISDPRCRDWLLESIERGRPGAENQAIRAHNPVIMRSFTLFLKDVAKNGILEQELRELMRARIATSWEEMFGMPGCHY